jgi:hypothetical protein
MSRLRSLRWRTAVAPIERDRGERHTVQGYVLYTDKFPGLHRIEDTGPVRRPLLSSLERAVPDDGHIVGIVLCGLIVGPRPSA